MSDPADAARISALESRLAALEAQVTFSLPRLDRFEGKIDPVVERVVRLEEAAKHIPSKGFIVTIVLIALTIAGGMLTVVNGLKTATGSAALPAQSQVK
ncbi:hypothetical protein [Methylobacterium tardum]|uniref:Uncharacterized protein n=1 Tax=Methylobacterium tardum TaxID=374432 RepID=A0AA37WPC5_9HYPH|nr:hypothetical protein [Methylobacterium tardum]URD35799.1 hypothetical protein M6G65_25635 [Methylobacterium tardum]GLS68740.1 hypothetical protein GCM10007890_07520 [Methylobacterium tardum]